MKTENTYMRVRASFPQVYRHRYGFLVSIRSRRYGLNERKNFKTEKQATEYARGIADRLVQNGKGPDVPNDRIQFASSYEKLTTRLSCYGRTPEEAVAHYLGHLGSEIAKQAKPSIRDLVEKWQTYKYEDTTLSKKTVIEIRSYARFIKSEWCDLKPDDLKRNDIDVLIKRLKISNNTRRKYLRYIRMFFAWVKNEGHILQNPTDGISYKPDGFNGEFYDVPTTKGLLHYIIENEKDLIGYYALLTFAGLRPSEGVRVEWKDYNFKTCQLYVRKGKTNARYITLESVAVEWMKFHRANTPQDKPFIDLYRLENRERVVRQRVRNGDWIQDGLRHGFGTYYKSKIKDIGHVADYMGNSADVVKRHYARTIPDAECQEFWALTPAQVLMGEAKESQ